MKKVIIESPLKGNYAFNKEYAKLCARDCFSRNEAPLVFHLLYDQPGILDDTVYTERELGIKASQFWYDSADLVAVYIDLGISSGMKYGIEAARRLGIEVEHRSILHGE